MHSCTDAPARHAAVAEQLWQRAERAVAARLRRAQLWPVPESDAPSHEQPRRPAALLAGLIQHAPKMSAAKSKNH